jgi:uncharacterized protein (TIGR02284 family)
MEPIQILDHLIEICVDSESRYRSAAGDVGKADVEQFFNQQAASCKRNADELDVERKRLGGDGDESGTFAGLFDRTAMDFNVIMSMGDTGVVEWCREDAQSAIDEYVKALAQELPLSARAAIILQLIQHRSTLASLEKVLRSYGGPRS